MLRREMQMEGRKGYLTDGSVQQALIMLIFLCCFKLIQLTNQQEFFLSTQDYCSQRGKMQEADQKNKTKKMLLCLWEARVC